MAKHDDMAIAEFLRLGGRKIPAGLMAKTRSAARKSMLQKKVEPETDLLMEGASLYGKLKDASLLPADDPQNQKALDRILRLHKKVATKKLEFPKVIPARAGLVSTAFSGTVVPPFDFKDVFPGTYGGLLPPFGNLIVSGAANKNGQISASLVTSEIGPSGGGENAEVGINFNAPGPGTLTISTNPVYSFEWLTNALNRNLVGAAGSLELSIWAMNADGSLFQSLAQESQPIFCGAGAGIDFGFKFNVPTSITASVEVNPSLPYLACAVTVSVEAIGMGWPGSLAVAMLSATVPSISYAFAGEFATSYR
jgi:hypothetical protein